MTDPNTLPNTYNFQQPLTLEIQPNRPSVVARVMRIAHKCQSAQQKQEDHSAKYSLSRWTDGIKDPSVRAVYVSMLQLIKRQTRGRR